MCAINPKHQVQFTISAYTSENTTVEQFLDTVRQKLLEAEVELNKDGRIRFHLTESE